jgi:hypothetical protein
VTYDEALEIWCRRKFPDNPEGAISSLRTVLVENMGRGCSFGGLPGQSLLRAAMSARGCDR